MRMERLVWGTLILISIIRINESTNLFLSSKLLFRCFCIKVLLTEPRACCSLQSCGNSINRKGQHPNSFQKLLRNVLLVHYRFQMAKHRDPRAWFKAVATFCTKAVDTDILIILQTGAAWVLLRWAAKALAAIDLGPFFWEARLQGTNLGPFWGPRGLWIFNGSFQSQKK